MSKLYEPGWGNPSLRAIVEPEFPEPVSLVPSTPGWWMLLLLFVVLVLRALWRRRQRYLRDRYRREALAQLATIKERLGAGALDAARELAPLLRATAMAAAGRDAVSGLQDEAYAAALADLAPDQERLPLADLQRLAYGPLDDVEGPDLNELMAALERWIQQHRGSHD